MSQRIKKGQRVVFTLPWCMGLIPKGSTGIVVKSGRDSVEVLLDSDADYLQGTDKAEPVHLTRHAAEMRLAPTK